MSIQPTMNEVNLDDPVYTHYLKYYLPEGKLPSEAGFKIAKVLDKVFGLNHIDSTDMKKCDWTDTRFIALRWSKDLSSYDFNDLTRLLFHCHDNCIRLQINPQSNRYLQLMFHLRLGRTGGICVRHPTIEDALFVHRENNHQCGHFPLAFPSGAR